MEKVPLYLQCARRESEHACHPFAALRAGSERSEGSGSMDAEILSAAKDDSQALRMTARTPLKEFTLSGAKDSQEAFSPNVCVRCFFSALPNSVMLCATNAISGFCMR